MSGIFCKRSIGLSCYNPLWPLAAPKTPALCIGKRESVNKDLPWAHDVDLLKVEYEMRNWSDVVRVSGLVAIEKSQSIFDGRPGLVRNPEQLSVLIVC